MIIQPEYTHQVDRATHNPTEAVSARRTRGYSRKCLKRAYKQACLKTRHDPIFSKESNKKKTNPIRIITKFSNQHKTVKNIIERYWHVLKLDSTIGPFIKKKKKRLLRLNVPGPSRTTWYLANMWGVGQENEIHVNV